MRLSNPQFTIRRLMVAVALAAMLLKAAKTCWVWHERSLRAAEYAAEAESWSADVSKVEGMMVKPRSGTDAASQRRLAELSEVTNSYRENERSNRELAAKYARAAARPWLTMEPVSPEPK
jgi:hypothetical protein